MRQTTHFTIERVVVSSERSYEQVKASLEARMGLLSNTEELVRQVAAAHASWEQITEAIEKPLGASGFSIFSKVEQGQLLALIDGKTQTCEPICHCQCASRDPDD